MENEQFKKKIVHNDLHFGSVVMDDKIWHVGGRMVVDINDPEELKSDRIEEYDPKEDTWSIVGRLMRKLDSRFPITWVVHDYPGK